MVVIPAIDIRGGRCVRLRQGDFTRETVFGTDPAATARRWAAEGAVLLHVVDLDGAKEGCPVNLAAVRAITTAVDIPVQLGGGLRTAAAVEAAFSAGVDRVVLGTAAIDSRELVRAAAAKYPGRVRIGIDGRDGKAVVGGWQTITEKDTVSLAWEMRSLGVDEFIYTDVCRDGMLGGPDIAGVRRLLAAGVKVIAAGGIASLADIEGLRKLADPGLTGIIVGRALYTGAISLIDAAKAAAGGIEQEAGAC
ncbi:MAG: 1-(5-phosphoribosyl)-5-[(5-phosphoribosylamino)methylideneamino]imidazole-4-carboxamide isomerase [bacterium]|jgi:phosphoribosylformimino-5-aminoimidazole carboxamide ribotide isomerase